MSESSSEHPLAPAWLRAPEDPAALDPAVFTSQYSRDAAGCVTVDSVPVTELAARFGSPSYVVSEATFRARARSFREAFEDALRPLGVDFAVYYASKALLSTAVAGWAVSEGLNIDTASGGELAVALAAGVPGEAAQSFPGEPMMRYPRLGSKPWISRVSRAAMKSRIFVVKTWPGTSTDPPASAGHWCPVPRAPCGRPPDP